MDHQPVVAIIDQQKRTSLDVQYQQEVDLNTLFKDVSEYVQTCMHPAQARQLIDRSAELTARAAGPAGARGLMMRSPRGKCRDRPKTANTGVAPRSLALGAPSSTGELSEDDRTALLSNSAHLESYKIRPDHPATEDFRKGSLSINHRELSR